MNENRYYVYEHVRPDRGEVFYVGKGFGRRANQMKQRNRYHLFIQEKMVRLGTCVEVRIVADRLTEAEAFQLERERIAIWRADGVDLVNMTDGGEGASGCIKPESARRKQSLLMKGVPKTPEQRAKMSATHMGKPKKRGAKHPPRTDEHRANLSKALQGRKSWNKGCTGLVSEETRSKMSASAKARKVREKAERDGVLL